MQDGSSGERLLKAPAKSAGGERLQRVRAKSTRREHLQKTSAESDSRAPAESAVGERLRRALVEGAVTYFVVRCSTVFFYGTSLRVLSVSVRHELVTRFLLSGGRCYPLLYSYGTVNDQNRA